MSRLQEARELLAATEGHTPGPWVDADNGRTIVVKDSRRHDLVFRVASLNPGCSLTANEAAANQQLTAAAPALRDLLAAMVAEVERLERLTLADKQCHDCGGMNLSHYDGRNVCQQCGWSAVDG